MTLTVEKSGETPSAVIDRISLVLDSFDGPGRLTLAQIVRRTGLPRSSAHRMLERLVALRCCAATAATTNSGCGWSNWDRWHCIKIASIGPPSHYCATCTGQRGGSSCTWRFSTAPMWCTWRRSVSNWERRSRLASQSAAGPLHGDRQSDPRRQGRHRG